MRYLRPTHRHVWSWTRAGPSILVGIIATLASLLTVRPWHLRWGATEDERRRVLPGDDLVPEPRYTTTRAITVRAPAAAVWPWLLQLGQGRGGFYSYDWLENLLRLDIHSTNQIVPEWQALAPGEFIAAAPHDAAGWVVAEIAPERHLLLQMADPTTKRPAQRGDYLRGGIALTWTFVLEPRADHITRVIVRLRADWMPRHAAALMNTLLLEPAHFTMERGMLRGIKRRAERLASTAGCSGRWSLRALWLTPRIESEHVGGRRTQ